jgi:DNA primase catalytic core
MPLLSSSTVQAVRDLPIAQVLEPYLQLKGKAGKLTACCPFHDEKTGSFHVDERRGFFHCFGCHAAGDGIAFVMKKARLDFTEAVQEIAQRHGVPMEHDKAQYLNSEDKAKAEAEYARQMSVRVALTWAAGWYAGHELPAGWAKGRALTPDVLGAAGLGFAPAGWDNLLVAATKQQFSTETLLAAGLIKERDGKPGHYYDRFRERVMFPIRDWRGQVVAFTGRYEGPAVPADQPQPAKYLNSPDETWTKGNHLYGLDDAADAIRKAGFAYGVEGQVDRLAMKQAGAPNTVAVGGTALTEAQVKLLARYTNKVVLVPDHDGAGLKALDKQAAQLLAEGLDVRVLLPAEKGQDPDDYLNKTLKKPADRLAWLEGHRDYLTHHLVGELMKDDALGPQEKAAAVTRLGELLETMPNTVVRDMYYDGICELWRPLKKYKLAKRNVNVAKPAEKAVSFVEREKTAGELETAERELAQLKADKDYGFWEQDNCYWKQDRKTYQKIKITNYTIEILYFVRAGGVSRLVCRFRNEFREVRQAVLTTDDLTAAATLDKCAARLGNFVFFGKQDDLNNLRVKLMANVPYAREVERLGHNSAGFYAWANGLLYGGVFFPADRNGFVRMRRPVAEVEEIRKMKPESQLEINGEVRKLNAPDEIFDVLDEPAVAQLVADKQVAEITYHYLPAAADLLVAGGGEGDDTMSKFRHFNRGTLKFAEWSRRIVQVYGESNGRTLVAFYVAALFRSTIYAANNGYFPLLYHFGQPQSGKSTSARSLARMFGIPFDMDGTNLEGGSTQTGIGRMLATVEDGIIWLNEYKNTLPVRMLGTLKGIADGSGKLLGQNTSGNETKVSRPRSAAVVGGQDLPTQDPALFSRCIINEFDGKYHQPQAQKELQALEETGHTTAVTCEVLSHYETVAAGYKATEPACTKELRTAGAKLLGTDPNSRAILNLTSLLTPCKLLMDAGALDFGFTYQQLLDTLLTKLGLSTEIASVSDDVETYLQVLSGLPKHVLTHGEHYQIVKENGREELLLRVAALHGHYLEAARRQGYTPLGVGTMRSYLKKHPSFIEERGHVRFSEITSGSTSCYAFDYYKIRQQGIEFNTTTLLADIAGKPIHLNGNLPELLAEFMATIKPNADYRDGAELLAAFNRDKSPAATLEAFRAGTNGKTYFGEGGALEVTWKHDQVRIACVEADF